MKQRLNFKIIGTLIIFSFAALLFLQGYWLKDMYSSVKKQNRRNIHEAVEMADYKELFLRISTAKDKGLVDSLSLTLDESLGFETDTSVTLPDEDKSLSKYLRFVEDIPYFMLQSLHRNVDKIIPINYKKFDSLLIEELAQRNIYSHVVTKLYTNKQVINNEFFHINGECKISKAYYFNYKKFSQAPKQYLYIYILNPDGSIIAQMQGILVSSGFVLLLIIITFIYLFRTIMRQKTVEELKTDFTNNITHEFKTPISVSYAAIDSLLEHIPDKGSAYPSVSALSPEKINRYLTIAKLQLTHLSGLIEQLLSLAVENRTKFKLRPEPILIQEIVEQLIEQHKLCCGKECIFTTDIPNGIEIIGDRIHIYNVINNLIDNAIKYCILPIVKIDIKVIQLSNSITITIIDNGIGIEPKELNHIFEKFYRIPNKKLNNTKGYGLGLYYVKDVMERHDGNIRVISTPNTGSRFTLTFKT